MQRKLILSKNALLWEKGDRARSIAILEQGKLAVKTGQELVGFIYPKMVLGENAIFTLDGEEPIRSAGVVALEDNSTVIEYPANLVKQVFELGNDQVTSLILKSLTGQIARNCLLIISANQKTPVIAVPLKEFMRSLVQTAVAASKSIKTWQEFMYMFRFLCQMRDHFTGMRGRYFSATTDKSGLISKASGVIQDLLKDSSVANYLEGYLDQKAEANEWLISREKIS